MTLQQLQANFGTVLQALVFLGDLGAAQRIIDWVKAHNTRDAMKPHIRTLRCKQRDRDSRLLCGYPMPCPFHTATIDLTLTPPTVTMPVTSQQRFITVLSRIAERLAKP